MKKFLLLISVLILTLAVCACGSEPADDQEDTPVQDPAAAISADEIDALYANPADFEGRTFEMTGVVIAIDRAAGSYYIEVLRDIANHKQNTLVQYSGEIDNLALNSIVEIKGTVEGPYTGSDPEGDETVMPKIFADSFKVVGSETPSDPDEGDIVSTDFASIAGTYTDADEDSLVIDAKGNVEISIIKLTQMDGKASGIYKGIVPITTIDAAGNEMGLEFNTETGELIVVDSTWDLLPNGETFTLKK